MLYLIWKPEGEEPVASDFRALSPASSPSDNQVTAFQTLDQVIRHLDDRAWPEGHKPWVQEGGDIFNPVAEIGDLPG